LVKEYSTAFNEPIVDLKKYIPGFQQLKELDIIDLKPKLIVSNGHVWEVPDGTLYTSDELIKNSNSFGQLCAQSAAELLSKHDLTLGVYNKVRKTEGSLMQRARNNEGLTVEDYVAFLRTNEINISQDVIDRYISTTILQHGIMTPRIVIDPTRAMVSQSKKALYDILLDHCLTMVTTKIDEYERINQNYANHGLYVIEPQDTEARKLIRLRDNRTVITAQNIVHLKDPIELIVYSLVTTMVSNCAIRSNSADMVVSSYKMNFGTSFTTTDVIGNVLAELKPVALSSLASIVIAHIARGARMSVLYTMIDNTLQIEDIVAAAMIYAYVPREAMTDESFAMTVAILGAFFLQDTWKQYLNRTAFVMGRINATIRQAAKIRVNPSVPNLIVQDTPDFILPLNARDFTGENLATVNVGQRIRYYGIDIRGEQFAAIFRLPHSPGTLMRFIDQIASSLPDDAWDFINFDMFPQLMCVTSKQLLSFVTMNLEFEPKFTTTQCAGAYDQVTKSLVAVAHRAATYHVSSPNLTSSERMEVASQKH